MNKRDAYRVGVDYGYDAGMSGDFTPAELADVDAFLQACGEISENQRQYAGHPGYDFNQEFNADSLWDAFERGESAGNMQAWRERQGGG